MGKINWFVRLFMSWESLKYEILKDAKNSPELQNLQLTNARLETENTGLKSQITDFKAWRDEKNSELQERLLRISHLERELQVAQNRLTSINEEKSRVETKSLISEQRIHELQEKLANFRNDHEQLKTEISKKLDPLGKIEKTFFASSGNKGKGELGERQLKTWLEKSGLDADMWTENLVVGSNQVEFAIKADINEKWIPVDSKVLDPDFDEEGNFIVNDTYKNRVQTQVKEVDKYLGKANTADYGLLVLQNDNIYIKLFDEYPAFFEQMIKDYKIYICSPSTFIQFAWTMSNILDIYRKIHKDEKLFDDVVDVLTTVNKLSASLVATHKSFNTAMDTHYPTLAKRQNALVKKMVKDSKIKTLPNLNGETSTTEIEEDE